MTARGLWAENVDMPFETWLNQVGTVIRRFGERSDSRATVIGLETDQGRFVVKHARDDEAIAGLRSAVRFHDAVSHPTIPRVLHHVFTSDGLALIEDWAPGEVLADKFDPTIPDRDDSGSPHERFLGLDVAEISEAIRQLFHAHLAVSGAGFVAVDLYDGCLVYDFDDRSLYLIDLDHYRPGPYALEADRQLGSSSFMAPEEWERGATIDERSTVFTLGRHALVVLGCARDGSPRPEDFRGDDRQFEILTKACASDPAERIASVSELTRRWTATLGDGTEGLPFRPAVRVLVIDHEDRVLLCQYGDAEGIGRDWWVPPGGGKEDGESDLEAARRELLEELDRDDLEIGPAIGVRNCGTVITDGRRMIQHERFFLCRRDHFEVPTHVIERGRSEGIRDIRWFSAEEIRSEKIDPGPRRLVSLIEQISAGDLPDPDTELGW